MFKYLSNSKGFPYKWILTSSHPIGKMSYKYTMLTCTWSTINGLIQHLFLKSFTLCNATFFLCPYFCMLLILFCFLLIKWKIHRSSYDFDISCILRNHRVWIQRRCFTFILYMKERKKKKKTIWSYI